MSLSQAPHDAGHQMPVTVNSNMSVALRQVTDSFVTVVSSHVGDQGQGHMSDRQVSLLAPDWDHSSFHGSVHTATLAVCTVLVIFVVILGTFGNGLVLLSSTHCRKLHSNFDILVMNLAGADFLVCSCLAPTFLYLLFSNPPAPRIFCGGFLFACTTCGLLSLLSLVSIALHRQWQVRGRVKSSLSAAGVASILATMYALSLGVAVTGTLHVFLSWDETADTCQPVMNSGDITRNNAILFFVSPVVTVCFTVIVVSYGVIARAVRHQTYLRVKSLQPTPGASPLTTASGTPPMSTDEQTMLDNSIAEEDADWRSCLRCCGSSSELRKAASLKHCRCCTCQIALDKENKAVTMCLVVILIITLSWTPLMVSHIVEVIIGENIILYQVKLCGIALVFLNSALDPYMYAQSNGRVKRKYSRMCWALLRCECTFPRKQKFQTFNQSKQSRPRTLRAGPYIAPDCTAVMCHLPPGSGQSSRPVRHDSRVKIMSGRNSRRQGGGLGAKRMKQMKQLDNTVMQSSHVYFEGVYLNVPMATDVDLRQKQYLADGTTDVQTTLDKSCYLMQSEYPYNQSLVNS